MTAPRKKIALCLEYPLALRGGVSVLVEILLSGLKDRYDLVLVSPDTPESLAQSTVASAVSAHLLWNPDKVSRASAQMLARQLAESGVHLAHFHLGGNYGFGNRFPGHCPILHLSRLGIPSISTVHLVVGLLNGYCGPQKPVWFKLALLPIAWTAKMQVLTHVRREIAVSHHDEGKLQRWYWPLRGKYTQMYHSRLLANSRPPSSPTREPVILNVGHIARRKGQAVLAEAFARIAPGHPEWKLHLVGDDLDEAEANRIKEISRTHALGDRIVFMGRREDAMNLMSKAGIYVQPSFDEALGLALQEAMYCGCPSIGSNAGGIPELIEHQKTGVLVEAGNATQLAEAIEAYIADSSLREKYGRAGAASIAQKGMTAERMLEKHVDLYERILGKH
jgi:glycosyltransferase involved in cell wall biosynthesis